MTKLFGILSVAGFIATIFAANYSIAHLGNCTDMGPCTIPVAPAIPGISNAIWAPSGVLWIGLAFVLRDFVHEAYGSRGAFIAIVAGAILSWWIDPAFAVASGAAFLVSETADLAVYAPLRRRRLVLAAALSNVVGLTVDSVLFLWLAFASLQFIEGQIIGKALMSGAGVLALAYLRRWFRMESMAG